MSNDNDEELQAVADAFLRGEVTVEAFHEQMSPIVRVRKESSEKTRAVKFLKPIDWCALVYPHHVRTMLVRFIRGDVDDRQIIEWANELVLLDFFVGPETPEDEDFLLPMWKIIQEMSAPEIDGDLTMERAREYIDTLDELES